MATSRSATPADPTLQATTDDNSRGGLFNRSNTGNLAQGIEVSGGTANDTTVTLTVSIDGNSQQATFTLDNPNDQNPTLTFTGIGGSGGGNTGTDRHVTSGTVNGNQLILNLSDGSTSDPIDVSSLLNTPRTDAEINTLADARIAAASLVRTVNGTGPDNTGNVTISGTGNTFADTPTVDFTVNSTTNEVTAEAFIRVGNGTASTTTVNPTNSVIVDPATGYQIVEVGTDTGVYVFQRIPVTPPPTPAEAPQPEVPGPSGAEEAPTEAERTVRYDPRGSDTVTMVTSVTVTRTAEDGTMTTLTPETVDTQGNSGRVIISETDATPPGDYRVMATVTTMSTDGETRTTNEDSTIDRFVPYYESATDITTGGQGTVSTAAWSGSYVIREASSGNTSYLAVLDSELASTINRATINGFRTRVAFIRTVTLTLADTTTRTLNVFRFQIPPGGVGSTISNFMTG